MPRPLPAPQPAPNVKVSLEVSSPEVHQLQHFLSSPWEPQELPELREPAKWCQDLRLGVHLPHAPGTRMTSVSNVISVSLFANNIHTHTQIRRYTYTQTHIRTYKHIHTYVHIHTCTHAKIHTYTHTHTHTHIHTYTHAHIHTTRWGG